jgi:hypothetical protein
MLGVDDDEVRRPVAATDDVLAVTGHGHVAGVIGDLRLGDQHLLGFCQRSILVILPSRPIVYQKRPISRVRVLDRLVLLDAFMTCTA